MTQWPIRSRSRPGGAGVLATLVALTTLAGCALTPDAAPRDLPESERTVAAAQTASGTEADGPGRVYLAAPGEDRLLRSVQREAVSLDDLIQALLAGPNSTEAADQFSTFLPAALEVSSTRKQGTFLFIDMSADITELTGQTLFQALAQIVFTATELDGIEEVQITVEGRTVSWPRPNGDSTTEALSRYDFPGLVKSAQPAFPALPAGG